MTQREKHLQADASRNEERRNTAAPMISATRWKSVTGRPRLVSFDWGRVLPAASQR